MAKNKVKFTVPTGLSAIPDGRFPELDKEEEAGFSAGKLALELVVKVEDLEARVAALETP